MQGFNDKELERGNQNQQVSSDRIHEYGARAYADIGQWKQAVNTIACISSRHMVGDGMVSFGSKLINRLILEETKTNQKNVENVGIKEVDMFYNSIDSSESSFALELALLQPLSLLSPESSVLHSSLLLLSASPSHTGIIIYSYVYMYKYHAYPYQ
jgi:hypothetical protein